MSTTRLYRYYRGKTNSYQGENFYQYISNDKILPIPSAKTFNFFATEEKQYILDDMGVSKLSGNFYPGSELILKSADNKTLNLDNTLLCMALIWILLDWISLQKIGFWGSLGRLTRVRARERWWRMRSGRSPRWWSSFGTGRTSSPAPPDLH